MSAIADCEGLTAAHLVGGINAETVAEALTFAAEVAAENGYRVRLSLEGRGAVGQLMWGLSTSPGSASS